ncbi:MAG: FMN-binding protein [Rhodothermales bacterium]
MNRTTSLLARTLGVGLLSLLLLIAVSDRATAQVARKSQVVSLKTALKEMLQKEGAAKLKKLTVTVNAEQARALAKQYGIEAASSYTVYQGLTADGALVGSVVIVNEQGKEGPLQVLVALRPGSEIYDLGFTVFGEDKGKPALSWGYLKQYLGKTAGDPIVFGRDIDGVSSATWTSTSVAVAVKEAVIVYDSLVRKGD